MPRDAPDPELAAALKALRERRGLTQERVAHEAGVTVGTLSKIETATAAPSWATVRRIAGALGVTLTDLVAAIERG